MAFLRKGFLKSAHRRNELYCRIDPSVVATIAFFFLLVMFMLLPPPPYGAYVDRVVARQTRTLPGAMREDTIKIYVLRDGTFCFGYSRLQPAIFPGMIRDAIRNGAEKRIYLDVDSRARYGDVKVILSKIQLSGIENVSILAESPDPATSPSPLPTP